MNTIFTYIINYWKRKDIIKLISLLYIVPILMVIIYNITKTYLNVYNANVFLRNTSYNYIINSETNNFSFYNFSVVLNSNYSQDQSIANVKYYKNAAKTNIFACSNITELEQSYFCDNNFIERIELGDIAFKEEFPLFITYDLQYQLSSKIGDKIYLNYYYYDNNGKSVCYSITFLIAGILRPYYDINNISMTRDHVDSDFISCAILNKEIITELSAINKEGSFIQFSREKRDTDTYISKSDQIMSLKTYAKSSTFLYSSLYGSIASILVLIIIVIIELNFIFKRNQKDFIILRLLGMKKGKVKLILFLILLSKFLLAFMVALIITKFILFDIILHIYCDNSFIFLIASIFIIAITVIILIRSLMHRI